MSTGTRRIERTKKSWDIGYTVRKGDNMYELVIIWANGDADVYTYATEEEAEQGGQNMVMALGSQVEWYGVREVSTRTAYTPISDYWADSMEEAGYVAEEV